MAGVIPYSKVLPQVWNKKHIQILTDITTPGFELNYKKCTNNDGVSYTRHKKLIDSVRSCMLYQQPLKALLYYQ